VTPARRLSRTQQIALDGVAAAGYLVLLTPTAVIRSDLPARFTVPLMVAVGAPVALRRRWPVPVFLTVLLASAAAVAAGVLADPFLAAAFALYPVALAARRSWPPTTVTLTIAITVLAFGAVAGVPSGSSARPGALVLGAGLLAGSWAAGRLIHERRAEAARAAAELAGRAVAEERLRIARELHDIVAHSMSVIAVQAGTANYAMAVRPGEAQAALRVIEQTSRAALTEMRQLLGLLRSGAAEGVELAPLPGPSGLPALIRRAEAAGVPVELDLHGIEGLPEGVALSVYRIVQEAVTNVVRHAAPTRCRVSVMTEADVVTIEVTDDGPGARARPSPPPGDRQADRPGERHGDRAGERHGDRAGHGLIGMRERALMHGGTFQAGPRPGGGFGVQARLPVAP
jgi:signal transduction histidine kinase